MDSIKLLRLVYRIDKWLHRDFLGGWHPMPSWLRTYLEARYTRSQMLYIQAQLVKGSDLSTIVKNDLACAESVTRVLRGIGVDIPIVTGTWTLFDTLKQHPDFQQIFIPQPGAIILSPTGMGNGALSNGHVGIVGKKVHNDWQIWSNTSATGKWSQNYTLTKWEERYRIGGGFPIILYKLKD